MTPEYGAMHETFQDSAIEAVTMRSVSQVQLERDVPLGLNVEHARINLYPIREHAPATGVDVSWSTTHRADCSRVENSWES